MAQAKPKASPAPAKAAAPAAAAGGKAAPAAADKDIPDGVRAFLGTFSRRLRQRNLHELQTMYMVEFPRFSERFFARQPWPTAESIADLVDQDENFLVLYRELYFRHMYRFLTPTVEDRFDSWQNYIDLFNLLLGLKTDAPEFELPLIWQFDIIDEFVYQFQNYFAFRARKDLSEADLKFLRDDDNEHTWSAPTVLRYLHALVKKAGIRGAAASASTAGVAAAAAADEKKGKGEEKEPAPFFKALAQFAAIQLCRVNCLLGDYSTALRVLDPIDLNSKRSAFSQVGGAYVTLYYYLSLAYLLSGRYTDAVKTASSLLMWAGRNSHDSSPTAVPRAHGKKVDQIYGLLALGTALNPQRLGESLQTSLRERFGDKLQRLQKMDVSAFEEVFVFAAPKFVDPAAPVGGYASAPKADAKAKDAKDAKDTKADAKEKKSGGAAEDDVATRTQWKRFSAEVKQRAPLPDTVSYLKLCTSITVSKLAAFCKITGPDAAAVDNACAQQLMALKTKTRALRWRGGAPGAGLLTSNAEVDVALNRDVVLVSEYKAARRYGEFLIRQILQLSRLADDINSIQTSAAH